MFAAGRYNALAASKQKPEPTACSFDEEQHITDGKTSFSLKFHIPAFLDAVGLDVAAQCSEQPEVAKALQCLFCQLQLTMSAAKQVEQLQANTALQDMRLSRSCILFSVGHHSVACQHHCKFNVAYRHCWTSMHVHLDAFCCGVTNSSRIHIMTGYKCMSLHVPYKCICLHQAQCVHSHTGSQELDQ